MSRFWCDYLDDQKFCLVRMIRRYRKNIRNFCRLLIENIADKNPAALNGSTPLHLAAKKGHVEIVRLIVETGVDKNSLFNGKTPLDLVLETSFKSFTLYRLLSKDKFQLCGLIFEDLTTWLCAFFFLCACLFIVMMMSIIIIGLFKFLDFENPHDVDKAFKEFGKNIMWPMGTLVICVTAFLLTVLIQPLKYL